jgi:proline iminopeptidase
MEGLIDVLGHKLFYESFGDTGERGTVLILHGGPGVPHGYLSSLSDLASFGYRVIFYDQLGCGKSEQPSDDSLFTVERYVEEVEGVRQALRLGKIHLLGQSWGGMLALAYALKYQANLRSLVIASGLASVPLLVSELNRLRSELPEEAQEVMRKYEALGEFKNPQYLEAAREFYRRHVNRVKNWTLDEVGGSQAGRPYFVMWGPNEFLCTGTLREWDMSQRLERIAVPSLITVGRYDEVTVVVVEGIHSRINGSRLELFENSSHQPMSEEQQKYMETVGSFLREVDGYKKT